MSAAPVRVLLVEDNPGDAELVGILLDRAPGGPYEVTVASRCDQARELLHGILPDIVLLDLGLPDSQGLETLDRILAAAPTASVVVFTGLADEELALAALGRGAQDYLVKGSLDGRGLFRAISYATQRKHAELRLRAVESQLLQAQKMEAIGRLAGSVAHDFNNLLTVILGSCDFLPGADAGTRDSAIADIRRAASRAASLTSHLLSFSRKQAVDLKALDLGDCILEIREMMQRMVGETIDLAARVAPGGIRVLADWAQIQQVFLNLVVNARDAMPFGGRIDVDIDRVGESQARLTVRDSGVGMSEDIKSRCFEPFYTTKEKGTGLGLSTVYGIVQQFGGSLEVESEPGLGAAFHVLLPLHTDAVPLPPRPSAWAPAICSHCPGSALVVEDQETIRNLVTRFLERRGLRVVATDNAEDALEIAKADRPDILLTDVVLPGMWGSELAVRVREIYPNLPIVQMSGYTGGVGAHDSGTLFLAKPFTESELLERVCAARKIHQSCPRDRVPEG